MSCTTFDTDITVQGVHKTTAAASGHAVSQVPWQVINDVEIVKASAMQAPARGPAAAGLGAGTGLHAWTWQVRAGQGTVGQGNSFLFYRDLLFKACDEGRHLVDIASIQPEKKERTGPKKRIIESEGVAWNNDLYQPPPHQGCRNGLAVMTPVCKP